MIYKGLSVVLLTFIIQLFNDGHRHRPGSDVVTGRLLRAIHRCRHTKRHQKNTARATLDPERVLRTSGDPGVGPSNAAPTSPTQAFVPLQTSRQDWWVHLSSPSLEREQLRESRPNNYSVRCGTAPPWMGVVPYSPNADFIRRRHLRCRCSIERTARPSLLSCAPSCLNTANYAEVDRPSRSLHRPDRSIFGVRRQLLPPPTMRGSS